MLVFLYIYYVFIILNVDVALSQSTVCVWGAEYWNPHINGLYTKQGIHDSKAYYTKTGGRACDQLFIYWSTLFQDYSISDVLGSDTVYSFCETSTTLVDCDTWKMTTTDIVEVQSNIYVAPDDCPSWHCDQISIPLLPECDVVFDDYIEENIWTDSLNTRYWTFNPLYFEWQCVDSYPDYCSESAMAYSEPGWFDLQNGDTASLTLLYPDSASYTVHCMNKTPSPTLLPTVASTPNPTSSPTQIPTFIPTVAPVASTPNPTSSPTQMPTFIPTVAPTESPSFVPTFNPSIVPTSKSTLRAAESKTTTQTKIPTIGFGEHQVQETTVMFASTSKPHTAAKSKQSNVWLILVIVALVICVCLLCIMAAVVYYSKVGLSEDDEQQMSDVIGAEIPKLPKLSMQRERVCSLSQNEQNDVDTVTVTTKGDAYATHESELQMWLCVTVQLPQYYSVLVTNGYDRLDIVREITHKEELHEIGISKGHTLKLLKEIEKLQLDHTAH
eukprot:118366_1